MAAVSTHKAKEKEGKGSSRDFFSKKMAAKRFLAFFDLSHAMKIKSVGKCVMDS